LLRRAHDLGVLPGDLHPGNLVVDAADSPFLLDLASMARSGDPEPRRRAAALAFFCQELDAGPLDARAEALLLAYLGAGPELPADFAALLARAARAVRARALAAFGRRSSRPCRHTVVPPRVRGQLRWCLYQVEDAADREPLHAACRAFAQAPPEPHKTGRRGSLWLLDDLAVKQREAGKAQRLFRAAYWLRFARVPQAEPVAVAWRAGAGFVFVRRLPMPSVGDELARGALAGSELQEAAASLGDGVGRLHAHGLRNRDLKLQNLVRDPVTATVCTVDLDGVRRKRPSDARGQGADLGRLLAAFTAAGSPGGAATVRTFVRAYLRARRRLLQPAPARRLWRRAAERARQWADAHR
jgi:tRNA A-37 threonylcarbamoyl transferase component Bud32